MARITIELVRESVENVGWKVLDMNYKNLNTPMTFVCDKGHSFKECWGKVRGKYDCPQCIVERKSKIISGDVPKKSDGVRRTLALDQSTHISGYSVFDDNKLVAFGKYNADGASGKGRILDVCKWLEFMVDLYKPDFVGIEDIQYNTRTGGHNTFKLLGQLMGAIFVTLEKLDIDNDSVLIPTWRKSANVTGSNRQEQKKSAQRVVKGKYGLEVSEDEADAICIGIHFSKGKRII